MKQTYGIIAGDGELPLLTARGIRRAGHRVVAVGFAGQYDPRLPELCDGFKPVGTLRIGEWARKLRRMQANEAVMVGAVNKSKLMYQGFWRRLLIMRPDWRVARLWYRTLRHDRRSQTLLTAVADELRQAGVTLIGSTQHIPEHLATAGVMTRVAPTEEQLADKASAGPCSCR